MYKITEKEIKYLGTKGESNEPTLEESNIVFTYNPSPEEKEWTNQNVTVGISASSELLNKAELQYSLDGKTWQKYEKEYTFEENGAIHARLINELYEVICVATGNVKNIDKIGPNEANIELNKSEMLIGESVTATVTQSDMGGSGIDITNCKYILTRTKGSIGTTDDVISKYTRSFKKEKEDILTIKCSSTGTYYLHVLSVDNAGNRRETISKQGVIVDQDTTAPKVTVKLSASSSDTKSTITADVEIKDEQSGVDISKCKWVYNTVATDIGTDEANYTGTFTSEKETLTLKPKGAGIYYLHILAIDNAGNKKEHRHVYGVTINYDPNSESLIKGIEAINESGYYDIKVNGETYKIHMYYFDKGATWTGNRTFGDANDVGTQSGNATRMVVVKVNGDLKVGHAALGNGSIGPYSTQYGGPKGFFLYVTGTLTIASGSTIQNNAGAKAPRTKCIFVEKRK